MLRKLHHRNIVQFYGACLEPGAMFFVTELMKGGDLYSALRHHADTMRWDRLGRKVATDVALGINYLHTRCRPGSRSLLVVWWHWGCLPAVTAVCSCSSRSGECRRALRLQADVS